MSCIRQVWKTGLESAFEDMLDIVKFYPYVAVRACWCGSLVKPISFVEYAYLTVKYVLDVTKCLQIAFAFADANGRTPSGNNCFQFNFAFDEDKDVALEASMDDMKQKGFDFREPKIAGINFSEFGETLVNSGLLSSKSIHWITYHGAYDLGYLLRAITGSPLPQTHDLFLSEMRLYFPSAYDVCQMLHLADPELDLSRLLSAAKVLNLTDFQFFSDTDYTRRSGCYAIIIEICFFKALQLYYDNKIDEKIHSNSFYAIAPDLELLQRKKSLGC